MNKVPFRGLLIEERLIKFIKILLHCANFWRSLLTMSLQYDEKFPYAVEQISQQGKAMSDHHNSVRKD